MNQKESKEVKCSLMTTMSFPPAVITESVNNLVNQWTYDSEKNYFQKENKTRLDAMRNELSGVSKVFKTCQKSKVLYSIVAFEWAVGAPEA